MANRYITPSAPLVDNNPNQTASDNAAALAAGQFNFGSNQAATSPPAANPSPGTTNDTTAVATGGTPSDPVAAYYANLADPSVADQPIKDQIQKNMQAALDAIDTKYVSIYAQNAQDNQNRNGQTRSENSRSGLLGSDFGNSNAEKTVEVNNASRAAIDAAKGAEANAVRDRANNSLTQLASDEIAAKKADALGQAQNAQALNNKNQENARNLIPQLASSGATLTDSQKATLVRNSGYDEATFDSLYNASLPQNQKAEITYHTIKKADGSEALLQISTKADGTTTQKEMTGYQTGGQVVKEYGGRPYVQQTDANGNITLKPLAGFVPSAGDSASAQSAAFSLKVKQAPATAADLAAQGYGWDQISTYFQKQGIDPGTPEIDDALHRAFSSQSDYNAWKKEQTANAKANAQDILLQTLMGGK